MQLQELLLNNFRNYSQEKIAFTPGVNVLIGPNAQGKTNLLEALYFLSAAKSFRVRRENELINWQAREAYVSAKFLCDDGRTKTLGVRWLKEGSTIRRRLLKNDLPINKLGDFLQELSLVKFVPADLSLIQGGPVTRRRLLDVLLCKLSLPYFNALLRYQKVLAQRTELLRLIRAGQAKASELDPWDAQFAKAASYVISRRLKVVGKLSNAAAKMYDYLCFEDENMLLVSYQSTCSRVPDSIGDSSNDLAPYLEGDVLRSLKDHRSEEISRGFSVVGPHRDDLLLNIKGHNIKLYGSQGQHRTASLALRLAEAMVMSEASSEKTIILLDDCFSELDKDRSIKLLSYLDGVGQVLITTAHPYEYFSTGLNGYSLSKLATGEQSSVVKMTPELLHPNSASFYAVHAGHVTALALEKR